jgi:hypothetical protein
MYPDSEILFPPRCIPLLAEVRGKAWKALVRRVARLPEDHPDTLALSLTVIRLAGCLTCDMDSYRASLGVRDLLPAGRGRVQGDGRAVDRALRGGPGGDRGLPEPGGASLDEAKGPQAEGLRTLERSGPVVAGVRTRVGTGGEGPPRRVEWRGIARSPRSPMAQSVLMHGLRPAWFEEEPPAGFGAVEGAFGRAPAGAGWGVQRGGRFRCGTGRPSWARAVFLLIFFPRAPADV